MNGWKEKKKERKIKNVYSKFKIFDITMRRSIRIGNGLETKVISSQCWVRNKDEFVSLMGLETKVNLHR